MSRALVAIAVALAPALALAQSVVAGDQQQSDSSRLWWMWIAVSVILLAGLLAIFASNDRARAARRDRAHRIVHGHEDPHPHER